MEICALPEIGKFYGRYIVLHGRYDSSMGICMGDRHCDLMIVIQPTFGELEFKGLIKDMNCPLPPADYNMLVLLACSEPYEFGQ